MGNCWHKFRKNKVGQDPGAKIIGTKNRIEDISEILSMFCTSPGETRARSKDENKMIENLVRTSEDMNPDGLDDEMIKTAKDLAPVDVHGDVPLVKKPVFFQVDFVQGMRNMPPRLASRMGYMDDKKKCEQMKLTDDDELMMDEIMEEFERQEKLKELENQLKAAANLRQQHLQSIKDKARRGRPPTRAALSRVE